MLEWWNGLAPLIKAGIILGAVVLSFAAFVGLKTHYEHQIISRHEDQVTASVLKKVAPANDKAAEARAKDTIRIIKKKTERQDAIDTATDGPPDAAELALNCKRLQQAGYDTSAFPSCS